MEELCKIAKAHYLASSDIIQKLAREFFKTMDSDGNGQVDLREFLTFMGEEGCAQITSSYFFEKLDLDRNGTLDFWEVMALYYIVRSGRPFCDHCKHFIPGTYFTCLGCLEGPNGGSFHLCLDCHLSQKSQHYHEGVSQFLDNYSLLEAKLRSSTKNQDRQSSSLEVKSRPSSTTMHTYPSTAMGPYSNNAIFPAPNYNAGPIVHNHNPNYYPYPPGSIVHNHNPNYYPYPPSALVHYPVAASHTYVPEQIAIQGLLGIRDDRATAIQGLLGMLVEGDVDNINQCFLEASRFGSTERVLILLQSSTAMDPYSNNAIVPVPNYNAGPIVQHNYNPTYYLYPPSAPIHYPVATSHTYVPERQKWKIALAALDTAIQVGAIGTVIGTAIATCSIL